MTRHYPHFWPLLLFFCVSLSGVSHPIHEASPRNVILIIADQMRGDALSVLEHPNARTPNLDRMANSGVLFTNYFTNNPVCAPSRMSMFSGLYPHEHGALSNKGPSVRFSSADNTLLGYFNEKGYRLGWFGKDNHTYTRQVLDALLDGNSSRKREAFRAYSPHTPPHWASSSPWPQSELFAYKTTTDAIHFISTNSEGPFFAVLSLFDPHPPYFAPADYIARYPIDDIQLPEYSDPALLSDRLSNHKRAMLFHLITERELKNTMAHYYAAIEWGVDHQVGRILDSIAELGIENNTIVVFTSEHGDFMGEFGMVRKGMFLYDALLHVPFIWLAKGMIEEGIQSDALTQSVDLLPTLIELTGGDLPSYSGVSLAGILKGAKKEISADRTIIASAGYTPIPSNYFHSPEAPYFESTTGESRPFHSRILDLQTSPKSRTLMARTKDWKLILSETTPPELYRMDSGRREKNNLAHLPEHAHILDRLRNRAQEAWSWSN